ncbi:MAG: sensor histidine kinase [Steroidobacteraceae bacterium]|jgi:signal transduction histidine kinase
MSGTPTGIPSTRWLWIAAIWCAGALFDATQTVLIMRAEGLSSTWMPLFGTELASWLPWGLATPLVIRLARRYPVVRVTTMPTALVHLAAFAIISLIAAAWVALLYMLFNPWGHPTPPGPFMDVWPHSLLYQVLTYLFVYVLILAITFVVDSRESMARQRTETARLNEELSRAQLGALRRQMEPHFLFNTLNSIAGLVRDHRNDAAVSMIVGLSEFLRRASEDSHRSQVTLAEEVEYLQRYLDIQKVRFGERLQIGVDIPAELLHAQVPSLLLQPLVENAIKHGIAKRVAGGAIRVAGVRRNGNLSLSVYNDGPSLPPDWQAAHNGIGIANLRTRLQILHGNEYELQLRQTETGGVEVLVTLPLREV